MRPSSAQLAKEGGGANSVTHGPIDYDAVVRAWKEGTQQIGTLRVGTQQRI